MLTIFKLRNNPYFSSIKTIGLILGLVLFFLFLFGIRPGDAHPRVAAAAAVAVLMAVFWITEALPIPVTSLLPLALFPLLGVMKGGQTAASYMNSSVFLFLGGFIIALPLPWL